MAIETKVAEVKADQAVAQKLDLAALVAALAAMSPDEQRSVGKALVQSGIVSTERTVERNISVNASGGLTVQDATFRCYSDKKDKPYTGTLNTQLEIARQLFGRSRNQGLVDAIGAFVDGLTPERVTALAKEAQDRKAERERKAKNRK